MAIATMYASPTEFSGMYADSPNLVARRAARGRNLLVLIAMTMLAGCPAPRDTVPDDQAIGRMPAGTRLRLVVVDDPALADQVAQLSGTWEGMTGSGIEVLQKTRDELLTAPTLGGDAVLCAPHLVGELRQRGWIRSVPIMNREQLQGEWQQYFELLRDRETHWGEDVVGVPFGSPVFVLYYRADLLQAVGGRPPRDWEEYHALAQKIAEKDLVAFPTVEPVGEEWAGLMLLARAASYISHPSNYSDLFHIDTMRPLIDSPPFIRALEEMVATPGVGDAYASDATLAETLSPDSARRRFWNGECAMAVTWPGATADLAPADGQRLDVGIARLPGSAQLYDINRRQWQRRGDEESPHVTLLSMTGRMGFVAADSEWHEPGFELLLWLSGREWGARVASASPETTLFRTEQLSRPGVWIESPMGAAAAMQYVEAARANYSGTRCVFALRIPGRERYLQTLSAAVREALAGRLAPKDALAQAAADWTQITQDLGVETQRDAYKKSVGIW